jgi:hypothetical protein
MPDPTTATPETPQEPTPILHVHPPHHAASTLRDVWFS